MNFDLPLVVLSELFQRKEMVRIPETEFIMNAEQTVVDYSNCGDENGALYGPYLYNALQVSARIQSNDFVIDLGCGSGRLLNLIASWNPKVRFVGLDLAPQMLAQARLQALSMGLTNITYYEDDFSTLDKFENNQADAIISSMALHHLPDYSSFSRCFKNIDRVLRPEGALYLMDFGHLRSRKAIEIFVSKVIQTEGFSLGQDYRASLYAAFQWKDFVNEISKFQNREIILKSTRFVPLIIIACSPPISNNSNYNITILYNKSLNNLSRQRKNELKQLYFFLKLSGMDFPA